jgi:predicted esterase
MKIITGVVNEELSILNGNEKKLFLGGFSQGCAMTLLAAFRLKIKWGGVFK